MTPLRDAIFNAFKQFDFKVHKVHWGSSLPPGQPAPEAGRAGQYLWVAAVSHPCVTQKVVKSTWELDGYVNRSEVDEALQLRVWEVREGEFCISGFTVGNWPKFPVVLAGQPNSATSLVPEVLFELPKNLKTLDAVIDHIAGPYLASSARAALEALE